MTLSHEARLCPTNLTLSSHDDCHPTTSGHSTSRCVAFSPNRLRRRPRDTSSHFLNYLFFSQPRRSGWGIIIIRILRPLSFIDPDQTSAFRAHPPHGKHSILPQYTFRTLIKVNAISHTTHRTRYHRSGLLIYEWTATDQRRTGQFPRGVRFRRRQGHRPRAEKGGRTAARLSFVILLACEMRGVERREIATVHCIIPRRRRHSSARKRRSGPPSPLSGRL